MKVVLTIAGSDSSGGAGIQADLKTFEAFGVFGASAITVLTAQNTTGVSHIVPMSPEFVKAQIDMVFKDFHVAAIKIGMLYNVDIIRVVGEIIKDFNIPIVLDPVAVSKAGFPLLEADAAEALKELFPYVSLITPNQHEATLLLGYVHGDADSLTTIHTLNTPVLIKDRSQTYTKYAKSIDHLFFRNHHKTFESDLVNTRNLHGTGCSFSSAITANLALGFTIDQSIRKAKAFINQALIHAPSIGSGPGPINHKEGGIHVIHA